MGVPKETLERTSNRLFKWIFAYGLVYLTALVVTGNPSNPLTFLLILALVAGLIESYYHEVYLLGRTKIVEPHVLEWKGDDSPYWTRGYIELQDEGKDFAWVCRYCGEYAIDGEEEQMGEVDCDEFEGYEDIEELEYEY